VKVLELIRVLLYYNSFKRI